MPVLLLSAIALTYHHQVLADAERRLRLDEFGIGFAAEYQIESVPSTGRISFNFEAIRSTRRVVLHVDARYNWRNFNQLLVLNGLINGAWGAEDHPSGFDFTPGTNLTVKVEARSDGFLIFQNSREIAFFPYRPGLDVNSVNRILVRCDGNQATQEIKLSVYFV